MVIHDCGIFLVVYINILKLKNMKTSPNKSCSIEDPPIELLHSDRPASNQILFVLSFILE